MVLTSGALAQAVHLAAARAQTLEEELNAADGKLGDGDTGVMLRRVLERLASAADELPDDVGAAFRKLATASAGATGSSLGTLLTTAFLSLAKHAQGQTELPPVTLGAGLAIARDAMLSRGGAALGDKTVVDALDAVARALAGSTVAPCEAALSAGRSTLTTFNDKPCRIGRARMFGEKSIGIDDPGMLAFVRLLEAVCGEPDLSKSLRGRAWSSSPLRR